MHASSHRTRFPVLPTTTLLDRLALSAARRSLCLSRTLARPRLTAASAASAVARSLHSTAPALKRRFDKLPELAMDVQALSQRLAALGVAANGAPASNSAAEATPLASYFFSPKSGSKHPDQPEQDLKLVVVALEEAKNVGPAKVVAASVGLKDMRAVSGADLEKLLGRTRDQGELSFRLS